MSKTSVIPAGLRLQGDIEGAGDLVVSGVVVGTIQIDGGLVIEEGGEVRGDVSVRTLVVKGTLAGHSKATERIRIEPTAAVVGDASAPGVHIVDGARFRGRVRMTGEPLVPKAARRRRRRPEQAVEPLEEVASHDTLPPAEDPDLDLDVGVDADAAIDETLVGAAVPAELVLEPGGDHRRRRKRRRKKGPPPPTIPTVGRQKARRKDRGALDAPPF